MTRKELLYYILYSKRQNHKGHMQEKRWGGGKKEGGIKGCKRKTPTHPQRQKHQNIGSFIRDPNTRRALLSF